MPDEGDYQGHSEQHIDGIVPTQAPAEEEPVRRRRRRQQTEAAPESPVDPNAKPKFWVNVGATINIGNYESMKLDMGVSGIEYDATSEDIERIMASADTGFHEVTEALMTKIIDRAREIKIARGLPVGED